MALGCWTSSPLDNITLNAANKKADRSLSGFEIGTGVAAHATLDTGQLISHTKTVHVDTTVSLQGTVAGLFLFRKCLN